VGSDGPGSTAPTAWAEEDDEGDQPSPRKGEQNQTAVYMMGASGAGARGSAAQIQAARRHGAALDAKPFGRRSSRRRFISNFQGRAWDVLRVFNSNARAERKGPAAERRFKGPPPPPPPPPNTSGDPQPRMV